MDKTRVRLQDQRQRNIASPIGFHDCELRVTRHPDSWIECQIVLPVELTVYDCFENS
jgi:hypothetical protein